MDVVPEFFSAKNLGGGTTDLATLGKLDLAVVIYWQLSCYPCQQEIAQMDTLQAKYSKDKVTFFALNPWDDQKGIHDYRNGSNPFAKRLDHISFLVSEGAEDYGPFGLPALTQWKDGSEFVGTPTTLVLRKGHVIAKIVGSLPSSEIDSYLQRESEKKSRSLANDQRYKAPRHGFRAVSTQPGKQ